MKSLRIWVLLLLFSALGICAAEKPKIPNVAVMDFTGDTTVSVDQLKFMAGKFTSELIHSGAFTVLDRGKMDFILKEQGFQQSGACSSSECKVQMGQLLGVDFLVSGNLVRFGHEYAFRVEYINVGSGQIERTVELSEKGELEDVYKELCTEGALQLAQGAGGTPVVPADAIPKAASHSLSTKRKIALALWGVALAGGGAGFYFDRQGSDYKTQWNNADTNHDLATLQDVGPKMDKAQTSRNVSYGVSIGAVVAGLVLWVLPEGR